MFRLFRKNVSCLSSSPSPIRLISSSHPPLSSQPHCEPKQIIPISVWWNLDYCGVPEDTSIFNIRLSIFHTLRKNGFKGPLDIVHCYGDENCLQKGDRALLGSSSTIQFKHVSGGRTSDHLLPDLKYWLNNHSSPYNIFMITGDPRHVHTMRLKNYNVLIAAPRATNVLCGAATILWEWSSIIKGEYLKGTHFNSPPDALECSWYGDSGLSFTEPLEKEEGGSAEDHPLEKEGGSSEDGVE